MNKYVRNMTQGSELKHILMFTLPLLAGNLFQQFYNIVDSVIVGRYLGHEALAAVGATGSITFLFYTLCNGLSAGAGILIAQSFGAGRHDDVKRFIANSAYALGFVGLGLTIISVAFAHLLLQMLDTPQNILANATDYMSTACAGTIAVAGYNWINSVLRALGDSKTPLYFLIVASILNVGLDLLFVMVFGMGVVGAALATVIAQGVSAVGSILFAVKKNEYFRLKREHLRLRREQFVRCMKTGTPIALQNALVSVSMISLQKTANSFGDIVVAAIHCDNACRTAYTTALQFARHGAFNLCRSECRSGKAGQSGERLSPFNAYINRFRFADARRVCFYKQIYSRLLR